MLNSHLGNQNFLFALCWGKKRALFSFIKWLSDQVFFPWLRQFNISAATCTLKSPFRPHIFRSWVVKDQQPSFTRVPAHFSCYLHCFGELQNAKWSCKSLFALQPARHEALFLLQLWSTARALLTESLGMWLKGWHFLPCHETPDDECSQQNTGLA